MTHKNSSRFTNFKSEAGPSPCSCLMVCRVRHCGNSPLVITQHKNCSLKFMYIMFYFVPWAISFAWTLYLMEACSTLLILCSYVCFIINFFSPFYKLFFSSCLLDYIAYSHAYHYVVNEHFCLLRSKYCVILIDLVVSQ